jgi:hypothetical protein
MLQCAYIAASLLYLGASFYHLKTSGAALSAAPALPSVLVFLVYGGFLLLGLKGKIVAYRLTMVIAVLGFGWRGVGMNIFNYLESGLAAYHSFGAWALALGINVYGLLCNSLAVLGVFSTEVTDY